MNELKSFAAHIRKNHLQEYVKESLRLVNTMDIPLMRFFRHLTEEQLFEMSVVNSDKFLSSLENGTAASEAEINLKQWEEDKLEGITRQSIEPSDLVLVYAVQKKTLFHFLPGYTRDVNLAEQIIQEMEDYFSGIQNNAVQVLYKIQRETENALRESEDIFKLMVTGIRDYVIYMLSPDGNVVSWNEGAERIKGYKADEIIGKHMSVFYTNEDIIAGVPENNLRMAREKGVYETENEIKKKDGTTFIADAIFTPLYNSKKELRGYVKITRDITERKKAEEMLKKSNERFTKIFNLNPLPTYITNAASGKFMFANSAFEKLLGLKNADIIGKTAVELNIMPETTRDELRNHINENDGNSRNLEISIRTANGEYRDILLSSDTIEIDQETCFVAAMIDITQRKKTEKELLLKTEELGRSNTELEQFAYIASHDLQEPLRMINSYVQLLATRYKDKLDQDANDFINFAVDGSNRMRNLINSLLEYSRVNRLKPFEWLNTDEVLEEVLSDLSAQVKESEATIIHGRLPKIYGDKVLIGLLFQNLIANAIKFRSDKKPEITIKGEQTGDDYLFSVQDNGIGIAKEYADKIFVIFQRLHSKEKYPGTGIGLAICKKIVERHGGKIYMESEPGKGTTFFFTIKRINDPQPEVKLPT